jgi:hypothetical protein
MTSAEEPLNTIKAWSMALRNEKMETTLEARAYRKTNPDWRDLRLTLNN